MLIEISDKFFDNYYLIRVARSYGKTEFVKTWSTIAKIALQQGESMANTIRIKRRVEVPDTIVNNIGFNSMVEQGMVIETTQPIAKLSSELFEQWWKLYPFRISNGKKVKIGKAKAKKLFDNLITNTEAYQQLMQATANYSSVCNKLPKDAERFIRADFWKEYLITEQSIPISHYKQDEVDGNYLQEMLNK